MSKRRADGTIILSSGEEEALVKRAAVGDKSAVARLEEAGKPVGAIPVAIAPEGYKRPEPSAPPAEGGRKRKRTQKKRKMHRRKTQHRRK